MLRRCGHCKKLAPEYAKAAAQLKLESPPLRLAKVDATEEKDLAEKYGVRGFPTLKLFRAGKASEYEGGRTEEDIVHFMKKKAGPAAKPLATSEELAAFKSSADIVVVGFFTDAESPRAQTFLAVASAEDTITFGIATSTSIAEGEDMDTAVLFKGFDEGRNALALTDATSEAEVSEFITGFSMPLVVMFTSEKAKQIFRGPIKIHALVFLDMADESKVDAVLAMLAEVAPASRGKILHIYVPSSEDRILDYFGVDKETLPQFVLADMSSDGGMKKFKFAGEELVAGAISAFEAQFFAGELSADLKSEEPSEDDFSGAVKKLVGRTFQQNVIDNDKDVLVEFYAPWCGHCKALEPKWTELAEKFAPVDSIMVGKMDATANEIDVDGLSLRGFPTIYFFPGDSKDKPIAYDSSRDVEGLTKFLQQHATKPFVLEGEGGSITGGPGHHDEL